ncbi:hypothetical protein MIDIC_470033 [Alphaproteobacteria bacterium]
MPCYIKAPLDFFQDSTFTTKLLRYLNTQVSTYTTNTSRFCVPHVHCISLIQASFEKSLVIKINMHNLQSKKTPLNPLEKLHNEHKGANFELFLDQLIIDEYGTGTPVLLSTNSPVSEYLAATYLPCFNLLPSYMIGTTTLLLNLRNLAEPPLFSKLFLDPFAFLDMLPTPLIYQRISHNTTYRCFQC